MPIDIRPLNQDLLAIRPIDFLTALGESRNFRGLVVSSRHAALRPWVNEFEMMFGRRKIAARWNGPRSEFTFGDEPGVSLRFAALEHPEDALRFMGWAVQYLAFTPYPAIDQDTVAAILPIARANANGAKAHIGFLRENDAE